MSRVNIITLRVLLVTLLAWAAVPEAAAQNSALVPRYNVANQHTYVLSPVGLTWQTARSYSRTLGGHLVAINNAGEQAFIHSQYSVLGPLVYWIGLTDEASEGVFVWDSEEPVTFTGFCTGEPNNFANNEDYVEIVFAATGPCWNDDSSPNLNGSSPTQGIIELAHGDRVNFDTTSSSCASSTFPTPLGATTHPEGISWNGAGLAVGKHPFVTTIVEDGMPVSGTKYFRMPAEGSLALPLGVAPPRPLPATVNEVRILIPPGAKGVSVAWELIAREVQNTLWNDGMDISVVDAAGFLIAHVVNADMGSPQDGLSTGAYCVEPGGRHILPAGPQGASAALPPLPHPAYLSIACWNGVDNSVPSSVQVDAIQFWGSDEFRLHLSAPFGPGSIRLQNQGGDAGGGYWTAVTLQPGSFPHGWFFGLDISVAELLTQVSSGAPFSGTLNGSGASTYTLPSGVPPGLQVYAVSIQFASAASGGEFVGASAPEHFVTP
jgi:Lectin C-type domain